MIRVLAIFGIVLLGALSACDNGKKEKEKLKEFDDSKIDKEHPAKITFVDTLYDFGTITDGDKVEREFTFYNSGESPLIILDAKSTCGCTVPTWSKDPILPGDSGSLKVIFDSKFKGGLDIHKKVKVSANTWPAKINMVHLTGNVVRKGEETE